jgi:hypothetical protein
MPGTGIIAAQSIPHHPGKLLKPCNSRDRFVTIFGSISVQLAHRQLFRFVRNNDPGKASSASG